MLPINLTASFALGKEESMYGVSPATADDDVSGGQLDGVQGIPDEHSEQYILLQARQNPAAFAPLYEQYFPRIYRYCLHRTSRKEDAEDLTSLVFTRALNGLDSYHGGSARAWLFQIAHNVVANYFRDIHRRPVMVPVDSMSLEESSRLAVDGQAPLLAMVAAEERIQVARLVAALPESQRELLLLRTVGGLSAKETGALVGMNEGAVRAGIFRIMQSLRKAYTSSIDRSQDEKESQ